MFRSYSSRRGSSYLEIQVAMVLLSIGMAGLYSMSVVQTKQTVRLTEVMPPDERPALNASADQWERKLGVFAAVEDAVTPAAKAVPYVYYERVVDNLDGDAHFKKGADDTYDWTNWNYWRAYNANARYHRSLGNVGSYAEFKFDKLPLGEYEVLVTYPQFSVLGTAIPHEIYDDKTLITTVKVNQTVATSEVTYGGKRWDRIAVVPINSGKLKLRMLDGPTSQNYIIADAVMVRSARSFHLLSVSETPGGGATAVLEAP